MEVLVSMATGIMPLLMLGACIFFIAAMILRLLVAVVTWKNPRSYDRYSDRRSPATVG